MKTLTKKIGIILILVPIVIGIIAFSVEAQNDYKEYKMLYTTYHIGDVSSDFDEDDEVTVKGLNGEELLVSTLRIKFFYPTKGNMTIQMQTLASYEAGKMEWYEEKIYITGYEQPDYYCFFGEEARAIEGKRINGEDFIYVFKKGVEKRAVHIRNKEEKTEFAIFYVEVK